MARRRRFLQTLGAAPLVSAAAAAPAGKGRDFLGELGVVPIINAAGSYTMFTGSLMNPEAVQAIQAVSKHYVRLADLQVAVGRKIAGLVGAEAAMVTSGAAAALALGTTACLTGNDAAKISQMPALEGDRGEVIIQKSHRFPYDHSVRATGVKLVEVETAAELERAIGPRTKMLLFLNKADHLGQIKREEFIALGRKHRIPTMNDAAADVPPAGNLQHYLRLGFDMVVFSGGKGICGPQSAGLLFGRKDLIEAARMNTFPISDTFGRGFKVNKEELVAMAVALENYTRRDHAAEWKEWERRVQLIRDAVGTLPGVTTERFQPKTANEVPHVRVKWTPTSRALTVAEAKKKLQTGTPAIEPVPDGGYDADSIEMAMWTLEPGEAELIAKRLREILA
jgi:D-glucosaminate-6-phosphate ammonia-lyase